MAARPLTRVPRLQCLQYVYIETDRCERKAIVAHITKVVAEAAKAPMNGQRFVRDDAIKRFELRVIASGAKSFIWEGRNGRVRRITIGQFPRYAGRRCAGPDTGNSRRYSTTP